MNTTPVLAALYARVSSEQQVQTHTIHSQVAALRERIAQDGLCSSEERTFLDEGYSGTTLVRPGLERLRDLAAARLLDRLYVHSPDRLARKYAYQVLLLEEFEQQGVEVVFLNRPLSATAEDTLLLQVQGMVAEYERAKILERNRRGKRHAAAAGSVSVFGKAPYGYRYVPKYAGGGEARYEIVGDEAQVVRQIFAWVGQERATLGEVCRRLDQASILTRKGRTHWDRSVVWGMLQNPAYMGSAAFGRRRMGPLRPRLRAQRGKSLVPRSPYAAYDVPEEEWIRIPVPALVEAALFAAVAEQLQENQRHARVSRRGARYLLQGLLHCACCGHAYYGTGTKDNLKDGTCRNYGYYRCIGSDGHRFGGERRCSNAPLRTEVLEAAVWQEVHTLLEEPQRLQAEYQRRLAPNAADRHQDLSLLAAQMGKLRQGLARLIDGYADGLLEKSEFEPRLLRLRQRLGVLEAQQRQWSENVCQQADLQSILGHLEEFRLQMKKGLETADWTQKRDLVRALVKRVEIDTEQVTVVFRVDPRPFDQSPDLDSGRGISQLCRERLNVAFRKGGMGNTSGLFMNGEGNFDLQAHGRSPTAKYGQKRLWKSSLQNLSVPARFANRIIG